ncbi:MAG: K(+)-transporting ATPase subunit F [Prolixibacteraceae bacterium]|jgi:K+-transporting ATPase KdpF subunit
MNTMIFILGVVPPAIEGGTKVGAMNSPAWYIVGVLLTIFLMAYLIYALIKPEKF